MIKLAVVGPGLIGKKHIELIQSNNKCTLNAIIAPGSPHNISIAKHNNVPLFQTLEECLATNKPDGVIISSPNEFHSSQATICINKKIPVLIEKPITATLQEAETLVKLVEKNNSKVLIGHHRAHSTILAKANQIISSGKIGKIVSVMGSAQFYKPDKYFKDGPWRTMPGGGPILINLIHEIGNLRSLCGEIITVHAFTSSNIRRHDVEDTASINMVFESGALGTFMLSDSASCAKSWEQTTKENSAFAAYEDEDCYVIAGTLGYISIPTFRIKYFKNNSDASWENLFIEEKLQVPHSDPLSRQLENFINVINGKELPLVSALDGFRNLKITEAISLSAKSGQIVHI